MDKMPLNWRSSDEEVQDFIEQEVLPLARGHARIRGEEIAALDRISALQGWHEKLSAFADGVQRAVSNGKTDNWSDMNWPKRVEGVLTEIENAIETLSGDRVSTARALYPSLASGELEE